MYMKFTLFTTIRYSTTFLFSSTWSPWLSEVIYEREKGISLWTLRTLGMDFSWRAKNVQLEEYKVLEWNSLDGFDNKGVVSFTPLGSQQTEVKLTISYDLPDAAAAVIQTVGPVSTFVEETLLADLKRFRDRLLREIREERMTAFRESRKL